MAQLKLQTQTLPRAGVSVRALPSEGPAVFSSHLEPSAVKGRELNV